MADTEAHKKMQLDYIESLTGLTYCEDVQHVPEGTRGAYAIEDNIDLEAGWYQELLYQGKLVEDNNPKNWWQTGDKLDRFANPLAGRVVVEGLGIGALVHEILKNPSVTHVTVFEEAQEVVDLVGPAFEHHKDRLTIVVGTIGERRGSVWRLLIKGHTVWQSRDGRLNRLDWFEEDMKG